jgi:phosphatidylinositol dimannoside acyltransferase
MTSLRSELGQLRATGTDLGFAAGWKAVQALPKPLAERAFRLAADRASARKGPGVQRLRANLHRVLGPQTTPASLDALVVDAMRSYARYWLEVFRLPRMDQPAVVSAVGRNTTGAGNLDAAVDAGRGYVVALPHMGNWDVAGLWLVDRYKQPFTTVAERLKPEALFDRFVEYRQGIGMNVVALTGGERPPVSVLTERLRAGGGVCLVADRDLSRRGIPVEFFGETARMPAGPAMLAAMTGAALLPVGLWFTDTGWGQQIGSPIEIRGERLAEQVANATQTLADRFAAEIAAHPADWHMLQRLWLADLDRTPDPAGRP